MSDKTTTYAWNVTGTDVRGNEWVTSGKIVCAPGDFHDAVETAQKQAFLQLTQGKAVYGSPGVGCRGPYRITKFIVEETDRE